MSQPGERFVISHIRLTAGNFFIRDLRKYATETAPRTETSIKEELGGKIWVAYQRMRGAFSNSEAVTIWHGTETGSSFKWGLLVEIDAPAGASWRKSVLEDGILKIISEMTEGAFQPAHLIVRFV